MRCLCLVLLLLMAGMMPCQDYHTLISAIPYKSYTTFSSNVVQHFEYDVQSASNFVLVELVVSPAIAGYNASLMASQQHRFPTYSSATWTATNVSGIWSTASSLLLDSGGQSGAPLQAGKLYITIAVSELVVYEVLVTEYTPAYPMPMDNCRLTTSKLGANHFTVTFTTPSFPGHDAVDLKLYYANVGNNSLLNPGFVSADDVTTHGQLVKSWSSHGNGNSQLSYTFENYDTNNYYAVNVLATDPTSVVPLTSAYCPVLIYTSEIYTWLEFLEKLLLGSVIAVIVVVFCLVCLSIAVCGTVIFIFVSCCICCCFCGASGGKGYRYPNNADSEVLYTTVYPVQETYQTGYGAVVTGDHKGGYAPI